jgi:isoleucyl-tRNA synthetase
VPIGIDDVIITQTPRAGWAVASDGGETVALDTTITAELRRAGLAREVIRLVQDARKTSGLDVGDRIRLRWSVSDPELGIALESLGDDIATEVLATDYAPAASGDDLPYSDDDLGLHFGIHRL